MNPETLQLVALGLVAFLVTINIVQNAWSQPAPRIDPPMPREPEPRAPLDLNSAIETVLVKSVESQGAMLERINRLNGENAQLAVDLLSRRSAYKAGKRRGATARRSRRGVFLANCRLCQDPMIGDPTVAEIIAHSAHRVGANPKITQTRNGAVQMHVDESEVETEEDGTERLEDDCPTCGGRHPVGQEHQGQGRLF